MEITVQSGEEFSKVIHSGGFNSVLWSQLLNFIENQYFSAC